MIKILEQKNFITTCEKCETKFSYENEDVCAQQTGMNEYDRYVCCPVCGTQVRIKNRFSRK